MAKSNKTKSKGSGSATIAQNRRARHDYFLEQNFEAGMALQGWEVKAIRQGHVQLSEAYISLHQGEAYLNGATITPLLSTSTHVVAEQATVAAARAGTGADFHRGAAEGLYLCQFQCTGRTTR